MANDAYEAPVTTNGENNENNAISALATMDTSTRAYERYCKTYIDSDCVLIKKENVGIARRNGRAFLYDLTLPEREPYLSAPDSWSDEQILMALLGLNEAYRLGYEDCLTIGNEFYKEGYEKGYEEASAGQPDRSKEWR